MNLELKEKIFLVTGASRGIGRACAIRLAELGANVAVNYRSHPDEAAEVVGVIEDLGRKAVAIQADVAELDSVEAMVAQIKRQKYFRWHDAGDVQSEDHLLKIFEVCKRTPDTKHWLPTREAQFLKLITPEEVPDNLTIRMSSHMVDQGPVTFWPWTSTVKSKKGDWHKSKNICPAPQQNNECRDCRACWDRNTKNVQYGKH